MTIFSSNFTSNILSGTVKVSGGAANISFAIAPFALEGTKNFVVKLRRGSIVGDVLAISDPLTIVDTSTVVSLTANVVPVAEGNIVSVSLITSNVPDTSTVFYSVLPVTANVTASDFIGANAGVVTVNNNQATFSFFANVDQGYVDETGETFKVQLRTLGTSGDIVYTSSNIAITDFYKLYNVFGLVETSASIPESSPQVFTFTAHNIPLGTLLYYETFGNLTSFTANTGSFAMNGVSNTISITGINVPVGATTDYRLRVRQDSLSGTILATSNTITVIDAALTYVSISGASGNVTTENGYTTHVFESSNTITFSGFSGVPERNNIEYAVIAGGGSGFNYGGGGAGGFRLGSVPVTSPSTFTVVVGAGSNYSAGNPSEFKNSGNTINISSMGGGYGAAIPGGSGAGGGYGQPVSTGSAGFGFPGPAQQGYPGGTYTSTKGGGGGGAGGAGTNGNTPSPLGQDGGIGGIGAVVPFSPASFGTPGPTSGRYFAGGGGGMSDNGSTYAGQGGFGGGGRGAAYPPSPQWPAFGWTNTGGGGGGGGFNGGSGIVIIRYVTSAFYNSIVASSADVTTPGNVTFSINSVGANGLPIYYYTVGNVNVNTFIGGNTGSLLISGPTSNIVFQANQLANYATTDFRVVVRSGSSTGNIVLTSNVVLLNGPAPYLLAYGGTEIIDVASSTKIHIFENSNTFTVAALSSVSPTRNDVTYLSVAGGGGGGGTATGYWGSLGGAGAGGWVNGTFTATKTSSSIIVGAGGVGDVAFGGYSWTASTRGGNTSLLLPSGNVISVGGGSSAHEGSPSDCQGGSGGTGPGDRWYSNPVAGSGYGYPSPTQQGYPGMPGTPGGVYAGGGGGAGAAGSSYMGGDGKTFAAPPAYGTPSPSPTLRYFAGGGGGGGGGDAIPIASKQGGKGGGGPSGMPGLARPGMSGNVNTGGGGGGGNALSHPSSTNGGLGGSGIVIIKYPYVA